ncbi:MAG: proline--tRNA ligase [Patescibacteria group bacterium]
MAREQSITPRAENFAAWYQDVIAAAELAEHSGVKGSMIIKPYGYAIWERLRDELDRRIKATGHKNAYFPLLIPESYLEREKDHVEGFSPELAVVTHAGGEKLEEPLVIRPTSETIIYETYSRWIQSYRDLPMLVNQWANVVRWELRPRLFLRTTEFLWQEGHTAHATEDEAQEEVQTMLGVYKDVAEEILAMPVIDGEKSATERFAGAKRTFTIEAMMQDGKALQAGTSHNLGQGFSEAFNVQFTDRDGVRKHVWLTSWGVSTRLIGGLIMTHSDDRGLVLPPALAPIQVVIVPISKSDDERARVLAAAKELAHELGPGDRLLVDDRDYVTAGAKFNEWERKGVPIRIELGPRDLEANQLVVARRDTNEKSTVARAEAAVHVKGLLTVLQTALLERAKTLRRERTKGVHSYAELVEQVEVGFARAFWCGNEECESKVKAETKATIRCLPFDRQLEGVGACTVCGGEGGVEAVWARAY